LPLNRPSPENGGQPSLSSFVLNGILPELLQATAFAWPRAMPQIRHALGMSLISSGYNHAAAEILTDQLKMPRVLHATSTFAPGDAIHKVIGIR
jgi:hypothetical protein